MEPDKDEADFWIFNKSVDESKKGEILGPDPFADYYDMTHDKRGIAVIFNQVNFSIKCSTREGSDKDRDDLQQLLNELNFEVKTYNDLNVSEITDVLKIVSKMDHSLNDCLLISVMTHGDDGILYGKDGPYPVKNLWKLFTGENCPSLAGKPKLFFIQACRGNGTDPGVELISKRILTDEPDGSKDHELTYSIPVMADILIMYSTTEGYYSWRDPNLGTYFIQSLVYQLRKLHDKNDLLTILTFVNRQVAIEFTSEESGKTQLSGCKQMCSIVSRLTRILKFNEK